MAYIIYDTETTGLPKNFNAPLTDLDNWPRVVQLAWQLHDDHGKLIKAQNLIVRPDGYTIPFNATKVHGITTEHALEHGHDLKEVLEEFRIDLAKADRQVGHNLQFDINVTGAEFIRVDLESKIQEVEVIDTMITSTDFCALPGGRGGKFKSPSLTELHNKLFGVPFADAHDAAYDVDATARCFFGLIEHGVVTPINDVAVEAVIYEAPELDEANFAFKNKSKDLGRGNVSKEEGLARLKDVKFTHLHTHTQFSILRATCTIGDLVAKSQEDGCDAVCLTDHGNMYTAYHFVRDVLKAELKPIVGCEVYLVNDHKKRKFTRDDPDRRSSQVLIAKNKNGYHNLAKLSSQGFIDGAYTDRDGTYARIDKELLLQYKGDLIATTGGLQSPVNNLILNVGEEQAEQEFVWWLENFQDDFYIELCRHGLEEEDHVNEVLLRFAEKYNVKYFAANNVYYMDEAGADAHDILLCVKDGEKKSTPIGRGRGYRFGFPNNQFYFKSADEMKELFYDLPEAIECTQEIVDKIESYKLARDVLLPAFDIPQEFVDPEDEKDGGKRGENAFLRHLTYVGAEKRYGEITDDIRERLDFELKTIENTGYPGYFLIVQDFTTEARNMGVSVGPGRGSAAGSAVAYAIGITNVDPIKYDLLFERFLNPDRVSLPDIDIDFDDEGRQKIINWVVDKYGFNQVSHIITYGTMAAKSSIKDTARVMDLPLSDSDRLAKLVPDMKLKKLFGMSDQQLEDKLNSEQMEMANQLKAISEEHGTLEGEVINTARILEGSVRNTGIHACGIIITPDDITKFIPVTTAKDADLLVTQFDNSVVENAGMLKMDFLGLRTLSIIKDAIKLIKQRHGIDIDPDDIPLDDRKTYELYQRGETNGTFQFESAGMQKHLRSLKPDVFGDLIAMNALYRPGPLEYIPNFIARKHGDEEIVYDIDKMDEYLAETYGITVYQEQVMLLSQSLAGFTKGEADMLRKAMGKKIFALLEQLKPKFIEGGTSNGHDQKALEKVWTDWEAFAAYAFNKSHSTCYSVVAFHTGYLKANYPAEYMASVLTHNMNDIKKVTFFMEECSHMGIPVLGPDINESEYKFSVNADGAIRFGLGAVKGIGTGPINAIIEGREEKPYESIFDFVERVNLKAVNRKVMESLAYAGSFDEYEFHRAQYFHIPEGEKFSGIDLLLRYGNRVQADKMSAQASLFGASTGGSVPPPKLPQLEPWSKLVELRFEKEVVGFFISGHPLDMYRMELENFCIPIKHVDLHKQQEIKIGGMITEAKILESKNGNKFGILTVEDYEQTHQMAMFGENFNKNRHFFNEGDFVCVIGQVKENYRTPGQWEVNPKKIMALSSVKDHFCRGIDLSVDVAMLSDDTIMDLVNIVEEHKGTREMSLEVISREDNMVVNLFSKSYKVDPSTELLNDLDRLEGIEYRVY
ncbi:DNA polymerase III subunit alpha [Flammeovirga sp. SJP92]|uniref:DNA polymerase III subunit alpha n=1 Tax=Flammeovirga sp. SJP92 TaxID=1775430 RepID=UPI000786904A|nr:DNA polymerase III subunit alpha [Flammeovirga sp. SJP92]KXX69187.1 DNA polymerase III subunit alpha [Flammeovirga sp. SJP92]